MKANMKTRQQARKTVQTAQMAEEILAGDLRSKIEREAGTSLKDTSKAFINDQDQCRDMIPKLFRTGCMKYHDSTLEDSSVKKLLDTCLERVQNDARCVGTPYYEGHMVDHYWLRPVTIHEHDILTSVSSLIPHDDDLSHLIDMGQSAGLKISIKWRQYFLNRFQMLTMTFTLVEDNGVEFKLFGRDEDDDPIEIFEMDTDRETMLITIEQMCTQPWYDLNDGIDIDGTHYESIRLKGKHPGQTIRIIDIIYKYFDLYRELLLVTRQ